MLAKVPKTNADMVAAAIRTIFARPTAEDVHAQFDRIVGTSNRSSGSSPGCSSTPAIMCRPGLSSIQVTLDTYGHLFPELEEDVTQRLDVVGRSARAPRELIRCVTWVSRRPAPHTEHRR